MDGCNVWKMEESVAGVIDSSAPCGVLVSPNFPGFVKPGYWVWLIEGMDRFYFDINVYYVRGPELTGGDCGQFFQSKYTYLKQMIMAKSQITKLTVAFSTREQRYQNEIKQSVNLCYLEKKRIH